MVESDQQILSKEFSQGKLGETIVPFLLPFKTHKINAPLNLALSCIYFGKHVCCVLRLTTSDSWCNANSVDLPVARKGLLKWSLLINVQTIVLLDLHTTIFIIAKHLKIYQITLQEMSYLGLCRRC